MRYFIFKNQLEALKPIRWIFCEGSFRKLCCDFLTPCGRSGDAYFFTCYLERGALKTFLHLGGTEDRDRNPLRNPTRRELWLANCSYGKSYPRGGCVGICLHYSVCQSKGKMSVSYRSAAGLVGKRGSLELFDSCPNKASRRAMRLQQQVF